MAAAGQFESETVHATHDADASLAQRPVVNPGRRGKGSFSLAYLFQLVTACGLFFACLQVSPVLAIVVTLIVTPVVIRTSLLCEIQRRNNEPLDMSIRLNFFVGSLGVVLLTGLFVALMLISPPIFLATDFVNVVPRGNSAPPAGL